MANEHIEKMSGRLDNSHKGDYGRVFVVAGSQGMTGAAFLCSQGALLAGSGLVTNGIPESLNVIMETKLTEVMTLPLAETRNRGLSLKSKSTILAFAEECDVVALGPGLGKDNETTQLIKELITEIKKPLIIDADAITAMAGAVKDLSQREGITIITPHPGEMAVLTGVSIEEIQSERRNAALNAAKETGCIICLKGHGTVVADPDGNVFMNDTGNSGMATGGTGDVLTGIIASFIGQGIAPYSAVSSAVYLHGLAGDIAAEKKGLFSLIASDILKFLPEAFDKAGI